MTARTVEILYFEGCPNVTLAEERVAEAARVARVGAVDVRRREVRTEEEAVLLRFPGSPTVRVDGVDVAADPPSSFGLQCRVYGHAGRWDGAPAAAAIAAALEGAAPASTTSVTGVACCAGHGDRK